MSNHPWLAFWSFVVAPCLCVVTPFLPVIKLTSSIPLVVVFLWNDGISHGCAMFFQLRHVFADAPCFYRCAIIFCVFGLRQKFWEQDSLGIYIYMYIQSIFVLYIECFVYNIWPHSHWPRLSFWHWILSLNPKRPSLFENVERHSECRWHRWIPAGPIRVEAKSFPTR